MYKQKTENVFIIFYTLHLKIIKNILLTKLIISSFIY